MVILYFMEAHVHTLRLLLNIDGRFYHFISDGDDFRIRLKTTLRDDHIRKFLRHIHV